MCDYEYIENHCENVETLKGLAETVRKLLPLGKEVNTLFLELNDLTIFEDEELEWLVDTLDARHENPISFRTLMTVAAWNRVRVIGYDNPTNNAGRLKPASPLGMENRNQAMGLSVQAHGGRGAIAIVGSFHLKKKHSGGKRESTLQAFAGLTKEHRLDLSSL